MESLQNKLVNFYLDYQVPLCFLSLIGLYALTWWSYENFKSVLQIIKTVLSPYFLPNENKSLSERYGKWAGNMAMQSFYFITASNLTDESTKFK